METNEFLEPYDNLAEIEILGQIVEVPEGNSLLRCFQYLSTSISYGDFCWNGECTHCEIWFHDRGKVKAEAALSCRLKSREGMVITKVTSFIRLGGINEERRG